MSGTACCKSGDESYCQDVTGACQTPFLSSWTATGKTCSDFPCQPQWSCLLKTGLGPSDESCHEVSADKCNEIGGMFIPGDKCNLIAGGTVGACCSPDASECIYATSESGCKGVAPGAVWHGAGTMCTLNNGCPSDTSGACCGTDGSCVQALSTQCTAPSVFRPGQSCSPNPCSSAPVTGACCSTSGCTNTTSDKCKPPSSFVAGKNCSSGNPCGLAPGSSTLHLVLLLALLGVVVVAILVFRAH